MYKTASQMAAATGGDVSTRTARDLIQPSKILRGLTSPGVRTGQCAAGQLHRPGVRQQDGRDDRQNGHGSHMHTEYDARISAEPAECRPAEQCHTRDPGNGTCKRPVPALLPYDKHTLDVKQIG